MGGKFTLDSAGLTPLAEIHSQVAAGLAQLTGAGGPQAADVAKSFGNIAFSVNNALDGVTQSRGNTLQATKGSSDTIAELLGKAEKLYAQGDQEGAAKLKAAAETLEGSGPGGGTGPAGAAGAGGAGAGAAGGGGAEMAGQMASQVGQQVGQLAQGMAQSMQGLAQGLTQLPQQIMQGIQGMAGSAGKGSDAETLAKAAEEKANADKADDSEERKRKEDEDAAKRAEEERAQQRPPARTEGAQPGRGTDGGPAPVAPPVPERPQPAQTRPQQFPL
ncbi:type VII secretion target [Mycobacterium sp. AT1]|uniref:type VII secretion target n=1 Tax=Mycobacterium sp. AT1 TaxID=1961706 RepID=UPI0009AD7710|nr:type VII secretion target [Mycobacterium sp. AT1]OPX05710.1 hypothetical protein B1790_31005 [Mycobacterium sp. AT1]